MNWVSKSSIYVVFSVTRCLVREEKADLSQLFTFRGLCMSMKKLFVVLWWACSGWVQAQTAWPLVQSSMYPYIDVMKLVRHEQTVLLGEGNQQTGIFYASVNNTFSEQVSSELVNDAVLKSWKLHSLVRLGTSYVLTFVQGPRILDIRLINTTQGVDAIYSIVLNQSGNKLKVVAAPADEAKSQ
jgi:hypothetical protein